MKQDHTTSQHIKPKMAKSKDHEILKKILKRIRRTEEFPTISTYITEINKKLSDMASDSSAADLANVILKDYALTNKILKLVNSAFYGFLAGKVTTVSRAVVLLGHDNVRMAAIGLVLFEHFRNKLETDDLKESVNSSFWRGLVAKGIAGQQTRIDPEEAFICALLFQLGKLLTIYHLPTEYSEIKYCISQKQMTEKDAVRHVLGISYRVLGSTVARQWAFPDIICNAMAPIAPGLLSSKKSQLDLLNVLANFTNDLSRIVEVVAWSKRKAAIKKLLHRYRYFITISNKQLEAVISHSLEGVYKHADALNLSTRNCHFLQRLSGPQSSKDKPESSDRSARLPIDEAFHLFGPKELQASIPANGPGDAISIIMDGIQEIAGTMLEDHDLNDVALMSIEIMYRALQSNRVVMFVNDRRHQIMEARFGYGEAIEQIVGSVGFQIESSTDLFNQAITSRKDLIVDDTHATALHRLIPDWYKMNIDARAFIFLPVVYKQICVGAFYADYDHCGPPVNALEHKYLALLRDQLVLAIKLSK